MKKIYATLGVVLIGATALFAQKQSVNLGRVDFDHFNFGSRTPTDTLWPGDFENGTPALYGSSNGGYVVGNNGYGDQAKGQVFLINNATIVEGAAFFFGGKTDGGNGSNVVAELRALDGTTGTTTAGTGDQPCPGTLLGSANIALSDVDTSGMFNFVSFTPAPVDGDFYIGFSVAGFAAGDTVGLVSTQDGEGGQAELSWEQWDNGAWYSMLAAWPLDFDLAIWAIVDNSSAGIESDNFFNGVKADVMPNPATEVANIVFDLEEMRNIDVQVIDMNGRLVYSANKGELAQGRHRVTFSVEGWAEGTYFYSIGSGNSRLTKKLVVKN